MMPRKSLVRGMFYGLVGSVLPIAVTIVTVPIYLSSIGLERYGVLTLFWLIIGYVGFLDLGIARAATNRLSQIRTDDRGKFRSTIITAFLASLAIGAALGLAMFLLLPSLFGALYARSPDLLREIAPSLGWIGLICPIVTSGGVLIAILEAEESYFQLNLQNTTSGVLMQILPLIAVIIFSPSVGVAIAAACIARIASFVWLLSICISRFEVMSAKFEFKILTSLLGYGRSITISNVVGPILVSADQLVIARLLGPAAVAQYAIPFNIAAKLTILPMAVSRVLFPRLSHLKHEDSTVLAERTIGPMAAVMALICCPMIIVAQPLLSYWLGRAMPVDYGLIVGLIVVGVWINALAIIPFSLLQAQGKQSLVAQCHLLELAPFIAVLWLSVSSFGLLGAAGAWTARVSIDALLLFRLSGSHRHALTAAAPMGLLVFGSFLAAALLPAGIPLYVLGSALSIALTVLYAALFEPALRDVASRAVRLTWSRS